MKILIVGMGIGQLYERIYDSYKCHEVFTCDTDPSKEADYLSVDNVISACNATTTFDIVHICTPNFTHESLVYKLAPWAKVVFVEKPGVINEEAWKKMVEYHVGTRIMMVKNNMWRTNIEEMRRLATLSYYIELNWCNEDRVPNPGTWFTTKKLSFGGVSRDLLPHLLSLYAALDGEYLEAEMTGPVAEQSWTLDQLTQTDYGIVNPNGTYDVDDYVVVQLDGRQRWRLTADWKTNEPSEQNILFQSASGDVTIELGLCPEEAYNLMIQDAIKNIDNNEFWDNQLKLDCWIHRVIENI